MKISIYLIIIFSITSCKSNSCLTDHPLNIDITTTTSKAMDKMSFTNGDVIDFYQWTNKNPTNKRGDFIYDGNAWTNIASLLWEDVNTPHFFIAFYPKKDLKSDNGQDDYIQYDITRDSALLCARVLIPGRKATQGAIPLEFQYIASRLTVELEFDSGFKSTPQVLSLTLKSIGMVADKLHLKSRVISGQLSNYQDIHLYRVTPSNIFMTHLVPQKIGELELVLDYNDTKLVYYKHIALTLESGASHNILFRVGK